MVIARTPAKKKICNPRQRQDEITVLFLDPVFAGFANRSKRQGKALNFRKIYSGESECCTNVQDAEWILSDYWLPRDL